MAAQDIVLAISPEEWREELKAAFLIYYKDEDAIFDFETNQITKQLTRSDLYELYKLGKQAPLKRSQYGKDVGTQVHEAIDRYHRGIVMIQNDLAVEPSGSLEQDLVAQKSYDAYIKWFVESDLEVAESECMVYSIEQNYAGTLDRIYRRKSDGALIIGDFKTSNISKSCYTGVRESYWSQLGAYAKAYSEEHDVEFADAVIVNSPKNGSLKVVYGSDAGFSPKDLESIWLDDIKAFRNHKFLRNARLKSRV